MKAQNPGIKTIGALSDGNNSKSFAKVKCDDDHFDGNDGRSSFKVTCGCNSSKGCRWVWKDNKVRQCLPKAECTGLDQVIWGGFVGNRIVGPDGVHLNTRMYYDNSEGLMDASDDWTLFLLVDKQLHSAIGNLSYSVDSLESDYVAHHVEDDCSSTIFQFQSNTFHGAAFSGRSGRAVTFNKSKYHQLSIDLRHLDLWQLAEKTEASVDAFFDNAKLGFMSGHHPDLTWCVAEATSERPPSGTRIADEYSADNDQCMMT